MTDTVNHPEHYIFPNGAEVIDITEHLTFNLGNVVKYVSRAGRKASASQEEDLRKALFYLNRELKRLGIDPEPKPVERLAWTISDIDESIRQMWNQRIDSWTSTWREWQRLEDVPAGVIVEDSDGDQYKRTSGNHFRVRYMDDATKIQYAHWKDVEDRKSVV